MLFSFLFSVSEIVHVPFAVWHSFASFVKFSMRIIPNCRYILELLVGGRGEVYIFLF